MRSKQTPLAFDSTPGPAQDYNARVLKMKLLQLFIVLMVVAGPARAQLQDVQLSASRQKIDEQKGREQGNVTVTTKEIVYKITVQSKIFKPLTGLQVKYMIFYADAASGTKEKPAETFLKGSETIANLAGNALVNFNTTPIKLTTEELDAGWYYKSGGSNRAKDKVTGVWIRAYLDGKMVSEYANPTTTSKKNDWKE